MKNQLSFATLALGAVLLAGCGGGGSSATTDPGGSIPTGPTNTFGPIETRGQVNGTPIARDLGQISTLALAGTLTEATYRPQGRPDNETAIAISTLRSIKLLLESGELIDTWHPALPGTTFMEYPQWSADGQKLYFVSNQSICSVSVTDPTTVTTVIPGPGIGTFCISPDGTKMAYSKPPTDGAFNDVYVRAIAGGTPKRITSTDGNEITGAWIDDDHVAVYVFSNVATVISVSTLDSVNYVPSTAYIYPVGRSTDGDYFFNNGSYDENKAISVTQRLASNNYSANNFLPATTGRAKEASISPDGRRWLVTGDPQIYTTELVPSSVNIVGGQDVITSAGASWQPALGVTKFVGAAGRLGTTSAGIIATQRTGAGRNGLASFVNWDATTRSTSTVSDDSSEVGSGAKTYLIEADKLTALRYANRPFFVNVATVSATGTSNGAAVTIDGKSGIVESVVLYTETRGAKPTIRHEAGQKIIEGRLSGVWNAKGENLAPHGANQVTLDAKGAPTVG